MSDPKDREADQEPAPLKHSDAETLSGDDSDKAAKEIEDDPSQNPSEPELRETKGG